MSTSIGPGTGDQDRLDITLPLLRTAGPKKETAIISKAVNTRKKSMGFPWLSLSSSPSCSPRYSRAGAGRCPLTRNLRALTALG